MIYNHLKYLKRLNSLLVFSFCWCQQKFKTGLRVPVFKNWVAMYGGRSAVKHMKTAAFGDVTLEFVKWDYENGSRVKVYRMSKDFEEIGQAREDEEGHWRFSTTRVGSCATASKYTVSV
jgi:hypothetical protein